MADYFKDKKETLSEVLNGDHLISAPYKLEFLVEKNYTTACSKNLTKEEVSRFRKAIKSDYYLQMYYNDLPFLLFVGEIDKHDIFNNYRYLLYNHIRFEIFFNKDRIVKIHVLPNTEDVVELTEDKETYVKFFYTVHWEELHIPFEKRMENYSESSFLWFSIMNSCVTLLCLIGFVVKFYIRVFKKEITEGLPDSESASTQDERGWKCIRDDVFRHLSNKSLLAAALGSGTQLFILTVLILVLGLIGIFHSYNRGRLLTALIIIYTITSTIAGYTATSFYCQLGGTNWLGNLLLTGCLFPIPLLFTLCLLNFIATSYKATPALPFGITMELVLLWTLIAFPLLVLGGIIGKSSKAEYEAICKSSNAELHSPLHIAKSPREIPPLPWYRRALPQIAVAGFLPFSLMPVELNFVISSVWGHGIYIAYKILLINFILVLIFIALMNTYLTCRQLFAEDHKWWWRSFFYGGSIGIYVFVYCIYYCYAISDWSGSLQISFFFGCMACISYGLFLMFGTVGFAASFLLVRYMYQSVKFD
ncbi:Nonaspanin [Parasponia andersonii]|uniref:Transmembrane 9 superfamily member n=1 Tax=Parasponia andersonii TaxID=3476 RepID=A0A2P5E138_PARAD|nr:Nonaspanin [Parasponia andersonii]